MAAGQCLTVKVKADNDQGFYLCNADSVPKGAKIFDDAPKRKPGPKAKAE